MCDCDSLGFMHREHHTPYRPLITRLCSVFENPRKALEASFSSLPIDKLQNAFTSACLFLAIKDPRAFRATEIISRLCRKLYGITVGPSRHTELAVRERIISIPPCFLCSSEMMLSAASKICTRDIGPVTPYQPSKHGT